VFHVTLVQSRIFCFLGCCQKNIYLNIQNYNLLVVVYGCETCSVIFRVDHRLRVFENRVLKRIFGPKKNEMI
jgi:hypothetical protein